MGTYSIRRLMYVKNCSLQFLIANENVEFLTSDNPSFVSTFFDGKSYVMPISPKIIVQIIKGSTNTYQIEYINDDRVRRFNSIIINNANELVLSNKPVIDYKEGLLKK
jgi:hypothetical protein